MKLLELFWPTLGGALLIMVYWVICRVSPDGDLLGMFKLIDIEVRIFPLRKLRVRRHKYGPVVRFGGGKEHNRRFLLIFQLTPTKTFTCYRWTTFVDTKFQDWLGGVLHRAGVFEYVPWIVFPLIQILLVFILNVIGLLLFL